MKIEIDTDRDSEHELRAALRLLQELLGQGYRRRRRLQEDRTPTAFDLAEKPSDEQRDAPPPSGGLFSMFDAPPATGSGEPEQDEDPDMRHYDEEVPRIEPY